MMFEMIVNDQIQFNFPKKNFSAFAKHLCKQLMAKDPKKRIGNGKNGINEIKAHPFFEGIDWDKVAAK